MTLEYRIFFLDGRPLQCTPSQYGGDYPAEKPPVERFVTLASKVRSRFFSMDVAKRRAGDWMVMELGDGQVAGLPDKLEREGFYRDLLAACRSG